MRERILHGPNLAPSHPATVVLIHEDVGMAQAAGEALLGLGCRVVAFADIGAPRAALDAVPADVVVSDYRCPPE